MTRTARRRWSREFRGEIDGLALGETGPVFVHGYDPPAGGKWIDDVIPGKIGAYERTSGEELWMSPCEVGYGRGFGSGLGDEEDLVVLGPGAHGHRIARMAVGTGELLGANEIQPFDQALVAGDMCVTVTPGKITGIMTTPMVDVWTYSRASERYHLAGRCGNRAYVVYTNENKKRQGVLALDVESGDLVASFLDAEYPTIHELVCGDDLAIVLSGNRAPRRLGGPVRSEEVRVEAFRAGGHGEAQPLWREVLGEETDDILDLSISLDSGKLYMARGALLEVRDGLSGRSLGELTLPGLDERVAWQVSQGAGLLAEENRVTVFELPA